MGGTTASKQLTFFLLFPPCLQICVQFSPLCFSQSKHRQSSTHFSWFNVGLFPLCPESVHRSSLKGLSDRPFVPRLLKFLCVSSRKDSDQRACCPLPPLVDFHGTPPLIQIRRQSRPFSCSDQEVHRSVGSSPRVAMMSKK